MNTLSKVSYRAPQRLFPLSLLAQLMSRHASACLEVSSDSIIWQIYLDEGKLTYATNSNTPFVRLDRQLHQLSRQIPTVVSAVRVQARLLFEPMSHNDTALSPDYRAICWLIEQQYLTLAQANQLVESLAKEVLEAFLSLTEGNYTVIEKTQFTEYPNLGQFDLRALVDQCQSKLQSRQTSRQASTSGSSPVTSRTVGSQSIPNLAEPGTLNSQKLGATQLSQAAKSAKNHYTIACIDDSPTVLESIKSFLSDDSFSVLMINDPVKALMEVVRNKPDLILLDVGMPNLDGYELCSLLRRHPHCKHTPIVMVTGNTGFIDRAKAKLAGASGYLTKPFTQPELLKIVFKNLTNS